MPPRRPRELVLRDRVPVLREREAELRGDLDAPLFAERLLADLPAPEDRLEPEPDDLARVELAFFAVPLERDDFDAPLLDRFVVEREPDDDLRAGLLLDELLVPVDVEAEPSIDHLPDITRCAASATASAISDPSFVALDITLLAACDAVSAASRPASRIFLRAAGLAAIAAAAAVRPAASISLLIAAFASLSIVLSAELEREDDELEREPDEVERVDEEPEREELLRADFAIFYLPPSRERHFTAVTVPK